MAVTDPVARQDNGASASIRSNATASQSVAAGSTEGCPFCMRQGIPILPLRYAVIPNYLEARRGQVSPQALFGGRESALGEVPRMQRHYYTVRTLREGFVYVYLNQPGQWQVYSVTPEGSLRLLADPDDIDEKSGKEMSSQCKRSGDDIPASFIHIANPSRTPVIWLAFSSVRWSGAVREKYEAEPAKRMQQFDVVSLDSDPDAERDAFELNNDAAQRLTGWVEEFLEEEQAPSDRQSYVSKAVGDIRSNRLIWESAHDFHARSDRAGALQEYARCYRRSRGESRKVAAVVLHDAMGMLQEINATRLDSLESAQDYAARRARPLTVSQSIVGLKQIIEHSALSARTADEQSRGIPDEVTETIQIGDRGFGGVRYHTYTTTRAERAEADSRRIWSDLAKHYDEQSRADFQSIYETVMAAITSQIEKCDADWAAWAQEPSWKAWLDDYDEEEYGECARFTEDYAACLAGGVAGDASLEVWQAWLEDRPDAPANPVYRALFFNQRTVLEHLVPEDGDVNAGDKLYETVKEVMGSEEFGNHVTPRIKAAVGGLQTAVTGALARVETKLEAAGEQLADSSRNAVLRAQRGVVLLYEGVEMTLLRLQLTVGEYQRLLSELAFRKAGQIGQGVQEFVNQAGRKVRSLVLAGLLSIDDPKVRDTVVEVLLWSFETAEELQRQITDALQDMGRGTGALSGQVSAAAGDVSRAGGVMAATVASELRPVRLGATLLSQEAAARLNDLRAGIRLTSRQLAQLGRNMAGKSLRVVGSGNVILAAGSVFFQGWVLRDSLKSVDRTLGREGLEAQIALLSPAVGIVGGSLEVAGFAMKALGKEVGTKFIRGGGVIVAGAAVADAVQSAFAATRTWNSGDRDAAVAHGFATFFYVGGAVAGGAALYLGSSALLGPLGIALALIVLGVVATWMALNAEDSQAEIWLDRCYFGKGNRSEGKWSDAQVADELAGLNAIIVGLSAKVGFSDAWFGMAERITGYERIDVEIRIVGFDASNGAYDWKLLVRHNRRGNMQPLFGSHGIPKPMPEFRASNPRRRLFTRDRPENWFRNHVHSERYEEGALVIRHSIEVERRYFQEAQLNVDYWVDRYDDGSLASVTVMDED